MRLKPPFLALIGFLLLTGSIFLFGDFDSRKPSVYDEVLETSLSKLSDEAVQEWEEVEDDPALAYKFWNEQANIPLAAFLLKEGNDDSEDKLLSIADAFQLAGQMEEDAQRKEYYAYNAVWALERYTERFGEDLEVKRQLAMVKIEGFKSPMHGVPLLLEVVDELPNDVEANFTLGKLAIMSGQYENAIKRLAVVLAQNPDRMDANYLLSDAYTGLGQFKEAKGIIEPFLEKDLSNLALYYKLSEICTSFKEYDEAINFLKRAKAQFEENEKIGEEIELNIQQIIDLENQKI